TVTGRAMKAGSASSFTTAVNADGTLSYTGNASITSVAAKKLGGSIVHDWDDFKSDIIKGGKKIKQLAVNIVDTIEHEITALDGTIYQFVITTFEQAVGVITGFFKTILADFKKAIEWLSALFDWDQIKAIQAEIVTSVTTFRTNVRGYLNQEA